MLNLFRLIICCYCSCIYAQSSNTDSPVKIDSKIKAVANDSEVQVYEPLPQSIPNIGATQTLSLDKTDPKTLKNKIESIKTKVLDSKSKLIELSKEQLKGLDPISYISIQHNNEMSSRFSIVRLTYILDGRKIYSANDLYKGKDNLITILNEFIAPGHHELIVELVCSGNPQGLFDYLKDYRVRVQRRYSFVVPNEKKVVVNSRSFEKGKIFTSFKDRPELDFSYKTLDYIEEKTDK